MKVQMQGHQSFNLDSWGKYLHGTFDPLTLVQNKASNTKMSNDNLHAKIVDNNGHIADKNTKFVYTILSDNTIQLEMQYGIDRDYQQYEFMYRAKKVSDRYIELPTSKYVDGDISGRLPPEVPDLAKIVPVEAFTGSVTAIE